MYFEEKSTEEIWSCTRLGKKDRWLVLASDGLWQVFDDETVVSILEESGPSNAKEACKLLLDGVSANEGYDNTAVVVVRACALI